MPCESWNAVCSLPSQEISQQQLEQSLPMPPTKNHSTQPDHCSAFPHITCELTRSAELPELRASTYLPLAERVVNPVVSAAQAHQWHTYTSRASAKTELGSNSWGWGLG